jgi:hypothetical protein
MYQVQGCIGSMNRDRIPGQVAPVEDVGLKWRCCTISILTRTYVPMMRKYFKGCSLALTVAIVAPALSPSVALAQDDCVGGGDQHTRGAELELTWATRRDDPQTKPERYNRALDKLDESFADPPVDPRAYLLAARAYLGLRDYVGGDTKLNMLVEAAVQCVGTALQLRGRAAHRRGRGRGDRSVREGEHYLLGFPLVQ